MEYFRSNEVTTDQKDQFSFEIKELENRLDYLSKLLDSNEVKVLFIDLLR